MSRVRRRPDADDEFGFDQDPSVFSRGLDALVPASIARRALAVSVETDEQVYDPGDSVEIRIDVSNRLPLPITVRIEGARIWGWSVDGLVEATDEPIYVPDVARSLSLRAGETRTFTRTWNGRIKRHGTPTRWVEPSSGTHEIAAFVATAPETSDSTTITIR
ncbi:hypothetical protein [Natronobeatus ordinarius]|uniref:hypothetical protein n=1 Tax=Natronobeatus ordinarius TaxID=2963433 RepID=UPI0020CF29EF|nr:hypothetical protein [Natronobeatus ordinarius]